MIVKANEIKLVDVESIKLNEKNRNVHPKEQIEQLVKIIEYQGFRRPVTISNRSGVLTCGEGRYLAALKLGLKQIPAMFQDYESEEQEYLDGIADNAIDKQSDLDLAKINVDLADFGPFDLDLLGLVDFKVDPLELETEKEPTKKDPKVKECPECGHTWI